MSRFRPLGYDGNECIHLLPFAPAKHVPKVNYDASRSVGNRCVCHMDSSLFSSAALAQKQVKRPPRATPPSFKPSEFSGIFFEVALAQLQGENPPPMLCHLDPTRWQTVRRAKARWAMNR